MVCIDHLELLCLEITLGSCSSHDGHRRRHRTRRVWRRVCHLLHLYPLEARLRGHAAAFLTRIDRVYRASSDFELDCCDECLRAPPPLPLAHPLLNTLAAFSHTPFKQTTTRQRNARDRFSKLQQTDSLFRFSHLLRVRICPRNRSPSAESFIHWSLAHGPQLASNLTGSTSGLKFDKTLFD